MLEGERLCLFTIYHLPLNESVSSQYEDSIQKVSAPNIETIVSLAKRRGFVFPSSEIYGGLGSAWDYGPLGVELCNNVKQAWWRWMVHERDDMEGIDSSIILNRLVWKYSGHEDTFSDPLVDCKECNSRFREDKLIEEYLSTNQAGVAAQMMSPSDGKAVIKYVKCPNCGKTNWTESRPFNLMFRTTIGAAAGEEDPTALAYLRPETAQGIFVNFNNVLTTMRRKIPFGIAQIGKSFRNEVTPGNFIFRTREFEQMEMEYFVRPGEDEKVHQEWIDYCHNWFLTLGISGDNLRLYEQPKEELAHYAKRTVDIHYRFFPEREDETRQWDELMGIANRTDFDLKAHSKKPEDAEGKRLNPDSTEDLSYFDEATKERFYPYVIEPAAGVNRTVLAVLMDAYSEKTNDKGEKRVILKLHPSLAPIKAAILPLAKNKPEIVGMAKAIKRSLQPTMRAVYDDTGGIGKLYARQDEIGTPFCVTVDHQSLEDEAVTVRDRDTWEQERVKVSELQQHLLNRLVPSPKSQDPS
ncbi:MAG: glycine--tRNA ligase [Acidobacteria bacterium]|nr:glycine--tRNA ligase [Acidobacteriota bacterium]